MNRILSKKTKAIIGIGLILISVAGAFVWEKYGKEALVYSDVLVFKEDVKPNTVIKKEMLGIKRIDKSALLENRILSPEEIVNKQATVFIPMGMQLYGQMFEDQDLATGEGEYIFAIPKDWVFAYPDTLRRGDTVYLYEIKPIEEKDGTYYGEYSQASEISSASLDQALISTKVAYVKDSGNREVVDVVSERIDASATAAKIEVVINDEKYQKLKSSYENGNKFILMYQ
jgi:hypothetical protein